MSAEKEVEQVSLLTVKGAAAVRPAQRFVAAKKFKTDFSENAKVRISYIGEKFVEVFLGKTETRTKFGKTTLHHYSINRFSLDGPVIDELDGEAAAETSLAGMFALMAKQGDGKPGALLISGLANIFYIRDVSGVLRAVAVRWYNGGWSVCAYRIGDPLGWLAGEQVFSR